MSSADFVRVETTLLPVGSRLGHAINGEGGVLLLAAGMPIEEPVKERILCRGITHVLLHPEDAAVILGCKAKGGPASTLSPASHAKNEHFQATHHPSFAVAKHAAIMSATKVAELKSKIKTLAVKLPSRVDIAGPPLRDRVAPHGCTPYDSKQSQRLSIEFSATVKILEGMVDAALNDTRQDVQPLKSTVSRYTAELTEDFDGSLVTTTDLAPNPDFKERGVRLAMLAMAMATELGWDEPNVREVGLCGLVHDWGMFCLPKDLQNPQLPVHASNRSVLSNHPLHTLDLLEPMQNLSKVVQLAVTQVHESGDGTGYPHGLTKGQIHPYANILHIADAYISLTAKMRGRQAYLSYDVIVYLLHQVKVKRMDEKAMRALLKVVSLFPLGSLVRLSDGTKAQVLRRNTTHYTAPIVQRVGTDQQVRFDSSHTSILDLARSNLKVVAPIPSPHRDEARIEESQYHSVLWEGTEG